MTEKELKHLYFEWMYRLVCDDRYSEAGRSSHRELLMFLNDSPYSYANQTPRDVNRAYDGEDLRYQFAYEENYDYPMIGSLLDNTPCSMLEMLIALSFKCESIMADAGPRRKLGHWFWNMLGSLDLAKMNDAYLRRNGFREAEEILNRFYNNDYAPNGEGGLFTIENTDEDLRQWEIWKQMCRYLDAYY